MKKILIVSGVLVLLVLGSLITDEYKANKYNRELVLEKSTSNTASVQKYTNECKLADRSLNSLPKDIIGISTVPPHTKQYFELVDDLGVNWIRAEFFWNEIEQSDGTYDWSSADSLVIESQKRGIKILGTINRIPTYLHKWSDINSHFQKITEALVERYKVGGVLSKELGWNAYGVEYWEIFNEPNLTGWGWLSKREKPQDFIGEYATLLAIANSSIRDKDSSAVIVLAGISSDMVTGMPYEDFLNQFYSYKTQKCFDVLAFHPYGKDGKFLKTASEIREIARMNGDTKKPLWYNEYGTEHNENLVPFVQAMFKERDAADVWFWFTLSDLRPHNLWNYGLMDYNKEPKEAFHVFKNLLKSEL